MHTWGGQKAWRDWSGRLAVAEEDEFERRVLPLLRLIWPGLQQTPRRRSWDQKGIDLVVWADSGSFPCAVQCKGFKVQELGPDQFRQIAVSIRHFIESDATAETFLVVHNREAKNRDLVARVNHLLEEVVAAGKATEAFLWSRQETVTAAFQRMEAMIGEALRLNSRELREHFDGLFRFSGRRIEHVPVTERLLTFRRDGPCEIGELSRSVLRDPSKALEAASGRRWTILTGQFGLGKTSTALAATRSKRPTVFVACQSIPAEVFASGTTNGLTRRLADDLSLDIDERDRPTLAAMAGSVLSYLLREPKSPFAFILDGLDEHHFFANLNGLQRLSNQLAEFSGPVVLTTRREHLEAILGDFNTVFGELGAQFGYVRKATALYLEHWTDRETLAVVDAAVKAVQGLERERLSLFARQLRTRPAEQPYGDLIHHPLFLQFILEDVADRGVVTSSRPVLIRRWVERKIRRDRERWVPGAAEARVQVDVRMDTDEYIERIMGAMQRVAFEMSTATDGRYQLLESVAADRVRQVVSQAIGTPVDLVPLLLNSVLVTLGPRRGTNVPIGFALRILHEFFAASYLAEHRLDAAGWPTEVQELKTEVLRSGNCN